MEVEGVLLAAGLSSRVGTNKLFLELAGKTVLNRCLESMAPVCSRIIVVGGHQFHELKARLKHHQGLNVIYNEGYTSGMFSSVLKGIKEVRGSRFFLCPGDYPLIKTQTYTELLKQKSDIVIPTFQGRSGHPVLISSSLIDSIVKGPHQTLRDFIRAQQPQRVEVMDAGIHRDIDIRQDYEDMVEQLRNSGRVRGGFGCSAKLGTNVQE